MAAERQLTELEGAVLSEIALRGADTAYKVRRAFQLSLNVHWQGSAGAVSPAIRRLKAAGLIVGAPHPSRAGQLLSPTAAGKAALERWATSIEAITSLGLDPFRLRSVVWDFLSPAKRRAFFARLYEASLADLPAFRDRAEADPVGRRQTELAIAVIEGRLAWLKARCDEEIE
ncbi:MAG: PadR family transcriptional regulator [Sphingomicrobium sp.]